MLSNSFSGILLATMISSAVGFSGYPGSDVPLVKINEYDMGPAHVTLCKADDTTPAARPVHHRYKRQLDDGSQPGQKTNRQQALEDNHNLNSTQSNPSTSPSMTTIDLTPAKFNTTCYPGTFQAPELDDCSVVIRAQLYNSTGSLQASPGEYVFVSYGTCATVFQNPMESQYQLEYNWAELGVVASKLATRCLLPQDHSMGGVAAFNSYLGYPLPDVVMSLQRFDDRDFSIDP